MRQFYWVFGQYQLISIDLYDTLEGPILNSRYSWQHCAIAVLKYRYLLLLKGAEWVQIGRLELLPRIVVQTAGGKVETSNLDR